MNKLYYVKVNDVFGENYFFTRTNTREAIDVVFGELRVSGYKSIEVGYFLVDTLMFVKLLYNLTKSFDCSGFQLTFDLVNLLIDFYTKEVFLSEVCNED